MKLQLLTTFSFLSLILFGCGDDSAKVFTDSELSQLALIGVSMSQEMNEMATDYSATPPSLVSVKSNTRDVSYTFNSSTNYWLGTTTGDYGGMSFNQSISVGLWKNGALAENPSPIEKVSIYGLYNIVMSGDDGNIEMDMTLGNGILDPLIWENINTHTVTFFGDMGFNMVFNEESLSMTFSVISLTVDNSGATPYPDGDINFNIEQSGSSLATGTITYNGTSLVTISVNGTITTTSI